MDLSMLILEMEQAGFTQRERLARDVASQADERALEAIMALLDHPSSRVRLGAAEILTFASWPRATEALCALANRAQGDERIFIIRALARMHEPRDMLLTQATLWAQDQEPFVAHHGQTILDNLAPAAPSPAHLQAFRLIYHDPIERSQAIALVLKEHPNPAMALVKALVESRHGGVRADLLKALKPLPPHGLIRAIVPALNRCDPELAAFLIAIIRTRLTDIPDQEILPLHRILASRQGDLAFPALESCLSELASLAEDRGLLREEPLDPSEGGKVIDLFDRIKSRAAPPLPGPSLEHLPLNMLLEGLLGLDEDLEGLERQRLWETLAQRTGLDERWRRFTSVDDQAPLAEVAFALASFAQSVEYVHTLERDPLVGELWPLKALEAPQVAAAVELVEHLRRSRPEEYIRLSRETEALLGAEAQGRAEDLGRGETFRFEEEVLLGGALEAMAGGLWGQVLEGAGRRGQESFWARHDRGLQHAWRLVAEAAVLGQALGDTSKEPISPEEGPRRLAEAAWKADQARARLIRSAKDLLGPHLPHFARIAALLEMLDGEYRLWAKGLPERLASLCQDGGLLATATLLQAILDQARQPAPIP